ncbi:LysR family transcriptional regulator [Sporolactobacillus pectinivorans]|uniref:LysR family transcriptional regulator n=1 Tax=Sporolactobacillus pectinivorans TaxID=1591408 RepID=UPI000C25808D|nr:LysR family transcriptional regulator [Sporolactobacillus pectinivorans]
MNTIEIEAFLAVVNYGSLTEAASSLFLSQSTLSHRITQLEKDVGMPLINRGRGLRSLTLTPNGSEFLTIAREWMDLIHKTKEIQTNKRELKLSIGAIDSAQSYILAPIYKILNHLKQKIDIRILTLQSSELYSLLNYGDIDIAIGHFEQPTPSMVIKKFSSEKMVVISKGILPTYNGLLIDQELDTGDQLYYGFNISFRSWYDRWIGDREYPTIHVDTANLLHTFMDDEKKWAIVPLSMANCMEETDHVSMYRLKNPPPDRICYQIRKKYPRENAVESLNIFDSCIELIRDQKAPKSFHLYRDEN